MNNKIRNNKIIIGKLRKLIKINKLIFQIINILKDKYIYYKFISINKRTKEELYIYIKYFLIIVNQIDYQNFQK